MMWPPYLICLDTTEHEDVECSLCIIMKTFLWHLFYSNPKLMQAFLYCALVRELNILCMTVTWVKVWRLELQYVQWRRPGAEFGGWTEKIFEDQNFWMRFFSGKNSHFHALNFWWPLFSHRPGFSDFPYHYCVKCRIWSFLHKKSHYFRKEFLDDSFFKTLFVLSRASDNTTSQNMGGRMHGPSPTSNFFGRTVPQSSYRSPPLSMTHLQTDQNCSDAILKNLAFHFF